MRIISTNRNYLCYNFCRGLTVLVVHRLLLKIKLFGLRYLCGCSVDWELNTHCYRYFLWLTIELHQDFVQRKISSIALFNNFFFWSISQLNQISKSSFSFYLFNRKLKAGSPVSKTQRFSHWRPSLIYFSVSRLSNVTVSAIDSFKCFVK